MNASVQEIAEGIGVDELAQRQWQREAPHYESIVGSRRSSST